MKDCTVDYKFKIYYSRRYIPLFSNLHMLHNGLWISNRKQQVLLCAIKHQNIMM
jgi:hypothetical protein